MFSLWSSASMSGSIGRHRRLYLRLILVTAVLSACAVTASAQEAAGQSEPARQSSEPVEPPASPDTDVVTGSRYLERLRNAPATMTVITKAVLDQPPSQRVTDLIRLVPGANAVQISARDINVTFRGASSALENSTLVLLDGRSLYQDFMGFVMWDLLPVDTRELERIEIIRGPGSAVWGANAMNGVVNMITKTPRDMVGTSLAVQFGQFDRTPRGERFDGGGLFAISGLHADAPSERLAYKVSAGLLAQEPLLRPGGHVPGTQNPYPPYQNRGTRQARLDARADATSVDRRGTLELSGGIAGTDGIIFSGLGPLEIHPGSTLKYGRLAYTRDRLTVRGFVNASDAQSTLLLQHGADGRPLEAIVENQVYDVEASNVHLLGARYVHTVSYGANFRHNRFDLSLAPGGTHRNEGGVYVQDAIELSDHLRWIVGTRVDSFDGLPRPVFSPRTALVLRPAETHTFRVSFNRAFRAPSLMNQFMDLTLLTTVSLPTDEFRFTSVARGNRHLEEEALTAYEAGYTTTLHGVTLGLVGYLHRTQDMILFTQTATYTSANPPAGWPLDPAAVDAADLPSEYTYLNFNKITARGLELSADARLQRHLTGFVNYSWQGSPRPTGFSASELNVPPRHRINAGISVARGRYAADVTTSVQDKAFWQDVLDARYAGWTEPMAVVHAGAAIRSGDGRMTVGVRAANLLNRTIQEHVFGDLMKRTLTGEIRLEF